MKNANHHQFVTGVCRLWHNVVAQVNIYRTKKVLGKKSAAEQICSNDAPNWFCSEGMRI
jgi:hypothetical protein